MIIIQNVCSTTPIDQNEYYEMGHFALILLETVIYILFYLKAYPVLCNKDQLGYRCLDRKPEDVKKTPKLDE